MLQNNAIDSDTTCRHALGKVYALLIRVAEEKEKQTAVPDCFGEETGTAAEQPTTEVEGHNE